MQRGAFHSYEQDNQDGDDREPSADADVDANEYKGLAHTDEVATGQPTVPPTEKISSRQGQSPFDKEGTIRMRAQFSDSGPGAI